MSVLKEIIEFKKEAVKKKKEFFPVRRIEEQIKKEKKYSIWEKLKNELGVIGEIKRSSPSAGTILKDPDYGKIAKIYEKAGVSGISVLTCELYFNGSIEDLKTVRENVNIPVLMKDFIIDEYQIYEGKFYGADFVLLITRILDDKKFKDFVEICDDLKLEILIEVHSEREIERVFNNVKSWEGKILGINNRDIDTLKVNINNTINLIKYIPVDKIITISESGIKGKNEVEILKKYGIRGILVGESILKSGDIEKKIKEFLN